MALNRMTMREGDHLKEQNHLFNLNKGEFVAIESYKTLIVLQKQGPNGELRDAFKVNIKDAYLGWED
jgi:hypothetical protein